MILPTMIIVIFMAECSNNNTENRPPEILWGTDVCDECRMIINESRFASAYITENREIRRFDDIGCMITFENETAENVQKRWFRDFYDDIWIKPPEAFIFHSAEIITPMASGLISLNSSDGVQQLKNRYSGQLIPADSLRNPEYHFQEYN
ncbi:MAG: nitrous oxide reductase accessory protein NosL [Calditrichaeota bacterium]|nr:nitrous oxide reductase accessory protein NosL [Calditrichota bacterium]